MVWGTAMSNTTRQKWDAYSWFMEGMQEQLYCGGKNDTYNWAQLIHEIGKMREVKLGVATQEVENLNFDITIISRLKLTSSTYCSSRHQQLPSLSTPYLWLSTTACRGIKLKRWSRSQLRCKLFKLQTEMSLSCLHQRSKLYACSDIHEQYTKVGQMQQASGT